MHLGEEPREAKPVGGLAMSTLPMGVKEIFLHTTPGKYHWRGRSRSGLRLLCQVTDQCRARLRMMLRDSEQLDHARILDQDSNSGGLIIG